MPDPTLPVIAQPRPASPWTARHVVNLVLVCVSIAAALYAYLGGPLPTALDAAHLEALAVGLATGLLIPGSPIGKVLDALIPEPGKPAQALTASDVASVVEAVRPPPPTLPQRVESSDRSRDGSTSVELLGWLVFLGALVVSFVQTMARHGWVPAMVLASAVGLGGCGQQSPVAQQATAIEVAAILTATASHSMSLSAADDAMRSCPDGSPVTCLDAVSARWAPGDAALGSVAAALGAWLAADRIASRAGADVVAAALDSAPAFVRAYGQLVDALALVHVDLPPIPPIILSLLPAPTAGGAS